ncbi:MAG TPA: hypothetical protein VGT04_13450 [Acidobacteriaceae bacterium]|nr:hypothetical protein [Acidobacteriaceae bacterium]
MAEIELPAELLNKIEKTGPVDLVIGVTGPAAPSELCSRARNSLRDISAKTIVAYAGTTHADSLPCVDTPIQLASFPMPSSNSGAFWLDISTAQRSVLALAERWGARACMVTHNDLAALEPETLRLLVEPVLQSQADLMMPIYVQGKYEGLISKCLLAPFSRALYGRRVRFPLSFDFCAGAAVFKKLTDAGSRAHGVAPLLWPANEVAIRGGKMGQAPVAVHHAVRTDHNDLTAILTEFAGSLFQEAEADAAHWQRVRGSEVVTRFGKSSFAKEDSAAQIDPKPMVESFVLGSRNLEEVWRLVLPPAITLELKRLSRLDADNFRMPDTLWARIVYDFALAHRMRRVSRTHVLGALTPLYLGWVASYTQEVASATSEEADRRIVQLAAAFEEQKPYFVSRWRWPERVS